SLLPTARPPTPARPHKGATVFTHLSRAASRTVPMGPRPLLWGRVRVGGRTMPISLARKYRAPFSRPRDPPPRPAPTIGRPEGRPSLDGLWGRERRRAVIDSTELQHAQAAFVHGRSPRARRPSMRATTGMRSAT